MRHRARHRQVNSFSKHQGVDLLVYTLLFVVLTVSTGEDLESKRQPVTDFNF
jgi:hypothetical protein